MEEGRSWKTEEVVMAAAWESGLIGIIFGMFSSCIALVL